LQIIQLVVPKNITIAQPRPAPPKPNRAKAVSARFLHPDSVMNSYFSSNGYGAPASGNRKQKTYDSDKQPLASISRNWVQGSAYANGYIGKSQSKLESNTGSMDRLARLKAQAITKSLNNENVVNISGS